MQRLREDIVIDAFKKATSRAMGAAFDTGWAGCATTYTDVVERMELGSRVEQRDLHEFVDKVKDAVRDSCKFVCTGSDTAIGQYIRARERAARRVSLAWMFACGVFGAVAALMTMAVVP
jgi:hypothetical protein